MNNTVRTEMAGGVIQQLLRRKLQSHSLVSFFIVLGVYMFLILSVLGWEKKNDFLSYRFEGKPVLAFLEDVIAVRSPFLY